MDDDDDCSFVSENPSKQKKSEIKTRFQVKQERKKNSSIPKLFLKKNWKSKHVRMSEERFFGYYCKYSHEWNVSLRKKCAFFEKNKVYKISFYFVNM